MFRGHHRKVRLFFGLSDIVLTALAFAIAYWTRTALNERDFAFENDFFLTAPVVVLLLGWSMLVWVALGAWWEIYDRIDGAHPRVILRDTFRQCVFGSVAVWIS